jgi:regulator of sigma E protease
MHIDLSQFNLYGTVVAILAFIVMIGLMVVVHEFGHFIVAKACRVRVEAFSFGFGPRLFGVKVGDTDYKVCALPLGGFVKMTGENPGEETEAEDPGSFLAHPRWQRMLIGLAGPVANFVLALVLMTAYYFWINEVPKNELKATTIEWVLPGSPAAQAGLQPGDTIRHFETVENPGWDDVMARASLGPNQTVPVTVERGGQRVSLWLHVPTDPSGDGISPVELGILPQYTTGGIPVNTVAPGTPAESAGLKTGDQIVSVDALAVHSTARLIAYMNEGKGRPLTLHVLRQGAALELKAQPANLDGSGWKLGFTPQEPMMKAPLPMGKSLAQARRFCQKNSLLIAEVLGKLFSHRVPANQLSGPIGIARVAGQTAESGKAGPMLVLAAAISLNLGILNLLPFPILDGGLILFLLIESAIRRDISMVWKERIYQAAFILIVAFFAFVIFNDVSKLPIFTHVKP